MVIKTALDDAELKELRDKVIGRHLKVIGSFVDTADTPFGQTLPKQLSTVADADWNGILEESELENSLMASGFSFLNARQVHDVFERADANKDGHIDLDEWMAEDIANQLDQAGQKERWQAWLSCVERSRIQPAQNNAHIRFKV